MSVEPWQVEEAGPRIAAQPPRLFTRNVERAFLATPLVLLGGLWWLKWVNPESFAAGYSTLNLVVDIVLLDTTHTVFTWGLFLLPELKEWRRLTFKPRFLLRAGAVIASLLAIFLLATLSGTDSWPFRISLLFGSVLSTHHAVMQMKGISFGYNSLFVRGLPRAEQERVRSQLGLSARFEHLAAFVLVSGVICLRLSFVDFLPSDLHLVLRVVGAVQVPLCLSLYGMALLRLPAPLRLAKSAYLSRIVVVGLSFTPAGSLAVQAMHGIEYGFISLRMVDRSKASIEQKRRVLGATLAMSVVVSICAASVALSLWLAPMVSVPVVVVGVLLALRATNTFTHFWFDAQVFRMKNESSRTLVAPLLMPAAPTLEQGRQA